MTIYNYKYLTKKHLKGFDSYKYSAIDTSPLSKYVMHPLWNATVKLLPKWIAPNLLTFAGFICMVVCCALLLGYDFHCDAADDAPVNKRMPDQVYTICGLLLFLAYNLVLMYYECRLYFQWASRAYRYCESLENLPFYYDALLPLGVPVKLTDGIDGKQARRVGVSGPLGEMFDHGLDSYIVFFIPFCLFSVFGRDHFSVPVFRGYLIVMSVVLNFYVSHWEKYNTGTLYLPWGYDLSMWVSSLMFLLAGRNGPQCFKTFVFGEVTFVQALELAVHTTGLFTTLPIAVYNVYMSYKKRTGKMYPLLEALRPVWSMLILTCLMTLWAVRSPNRILETQLRPFLLLFGTIFSNISSRLIVSEMSGVQCDIVSPLLWLLPGLLAVGLYQPHLEVPILYTAIGLFVFAHMHYGVCVVRQMCDHFKVSCFTVPKSKQK